MRVQYLIALSLFFVACGGDSETEETTEQSNDQTTEEVVDSTLFEEEATEEVEVFLEDMPSNWIMLTDVGEEEEELVIYNYCEAETQGFQLSPGKGDYWTMWIAYGQDGEECEITFFEAFEYDEGGETVVRGEIRYNSQGDESIRFIDFWWNKSFQLANFEGTGLSSSYFVAEEDQDVYESVDEDCEGLWE